MSVADRIRSALAAVPSLDLSVRELETLGGLRRGCVQKIMDGESMDPRGSTLVAVAKVLGTTSDFLSAGIGEAPSERRIKQAVLGAREHAASVTTKVAKRNGRASSAKRSNSTRGVQRRAGGRAPQTSAAN